MERTKIVREIIERNRIDKERIERESIDRKSIQRNRIDKERIERERALTEKVSRETELTEKESRERELTEKYLTKKEWAEKELSGKHFSTRKTLAKKIFDLEEIDADININEIIKDMKKEEKERLLYDFAYPAPPILKSEVDVRREESKIRASKSASSTKGDVHRQRSKIRAARYASSTDDEKEDDDEVTRSRSTQIKRKHGKRDKGKGARRGEEEYLSDEFAEYLSDEFAVSRGSRPLSRPTRSRTEQQQIAGQSRHQLESSSQSLDQREIRGKSRKFPRSPRGRSSQEDEDDEETRSISSQIRRKRGKRDIGKGARGDRGTSESESRSPSQLSSQRSSQLSFFDTNSSQNSTASEKDEPIPRKPFQKKELAYSKKKKSTSTSRKASGSKSSKTKLSSASSFVSDHWQPVSDTRLTRIETQTQRQGGSVRSPGASPSQTSHDSLLVKSHTSLLAKSSSRRRYPLQGVSDEGGLSDPWTATLIGRVISRGSTASGSQYSESTEGAVEFIGPLEEHEIDLRFPEELTYEDLQNVLTFGKNNRERQGTLYSEEVHAKQHANDSDSGTEEATNDAFAISDQKFTSVKTTSSRFNLAAKKIGMMAAFMGKKKEEPKPPPVKTPSKWAMIMSKDKFKLKIKTLSKVVSALRSMKDYGNSLTDFSNKQRKTINKISAEEAGTYDIHVHYHNDLYTLDQEADEFCYVDLGLSKMTLKDFGLPCPYRAEMDRFYTFVKRSTAFVISKTDLNTIF